MFLREVQKFNKYKENKGKKRRMMYRVIQNTKAYFFLPEQRQYYNRVAHVPHFCIRDMLVFLLLPRAAKYFSWWPIGNTAGIERISSP